MKLEYIALLGVLVFCNGCPNMHTVAYSVTGQELTIRHNWIPPDTTAEWQYGKITNPTRYSQSLWLTDGKLISRFSGKIAFSADSRFYREIAAGQWEFVDAITIPAGETTRFLLRTKPTPFGYDIPVEFAFTEKGARKATRKDQLFCVDSRKGDSQITEGRPVTLDWWLVLSP